MGMDEENKMEHSESLDAGNKSHVYAPLIEQEGAAVQSDTTLSQSYSGDDIPTDNEYKENLNQLGGSSVSNRDFDSYKSRTMPSESCDSAYVRDATNSTTDVSRKDNSQPLKSSNQLSSGHRSASQLQAPRKLSLCSTNNQGGYYARDTGVNYRPNARMWNGNVGLNLKEKCNIHRELEATTVLGRGPRCQGKRSVSKSPVVDKRVWLSVRRDQYNLADFQTKYNNAKFYVIKSFSEDDVHKCIKYNVWSSTPYGNKKLDVAFQNTQDETSEAGPVCPIFLFYSVNQSGQFVGLAEMIGKVDFAKNLDFWQSDKWNGFFPVKWHIIKDIPNTKLKHIIIENNDNNPVTYTRDTQQIDLQQGLEMLKIFKNYTATTSLLDDFSFYENKEQSLKAKRNHMSSYSNRET